MSKGFIYAMINTANKFIKIGKTTKDPEERAKELSSTTGVPTPYIVAYSLEVNNCHLAEKEIHAFFHEHRVNNNREFFNTSLQEVIKFMNSKVEEWKTPENNFSFKVSDIVVSSPDNYVILEGNGNGDTLKEIDIICNSDKNKFYIVLNIFKEVENQIIKQDYLDNQDKVYLLLKHEYQENNSEFSIGDIFYRVSADNEEAEEEYEEGYVSEGAYYLEIGKNYYYGNDDNIQDYRIAKRYFEDALKYGEPEAYEFLGLLYLYGDGVKENIDRAIHYFEQGISNGHFDCYKNLADIYSLEENFSNARFCWDKLFSSYSDFDIDENFNFILNLNSYIDFCLRHIFPINNYELITKNKEIIIENLLDYLNITKENWETKNFEQFKETSEIILFALGEPESYENIEALKLFRESITENNYGNIIKKDVYFLNKILKLYPKEYLENLKYGKILRELIKNKINEMKYGTK